jgi:spore germination protein
LLLYTVQQGDSIYSIARRFNVPMQRVLSDNQVENPQQLVVGQSLVINTENLTHTVAPGESLYTIAFRYNTTIPAILGVNPGLSTSSVLQPGQQLNIPVAGPKLGTIYVNGYALVPGIRSNVLSSTLPHLTYVSPFSYQVNANGSLNPIEDNSVIQAARQQNVAPIMVITNIKTGSGFDSDLAHTILTNESVQNTLLQNVTNTMRSKNYFGLNIDFEYIFPEDREAYNNFLRKVTETLHPLGYIVTTALAPKISGDQQGLLYEAHDYAVHGELADFVILMTYEWGYLRGPAQAVAPANKVEQVLQYAVSVIPSNKILMGMPNYGYDWTLPFVPGSTARPVTNQEAVNLASRVGARIWFDMNAQAPYFRYYDSQGREHVVWFDDARSIQARLKFVNKYNLGGVSYWTINNFFPQNWMVLDSMYNVRKVL